MWIWPYGDSVDMGGTGWSSGRFWGLFSCLLLSSLDAFRLWIGEGVCRPGGLVTISAYEHSKRGLEGLSITCSVRFCVVHSTFVNFWYISFCYSCFLLNFGVSGYVALHIGVL